LTWTRPIPIIRAPCGAPGKWRVLQIGPHSPHRVSAISRGARGGPRKWRGVLV